jgi:choline dehydrogenase-like flavoprotein
MEDSLNVLRNSPIRAAKELLKYIVYGTGIFSVPFTQSSIFLRSDAITISKDSESVEVDTTASSLDQRIPKNLPDLEIMPIASRVSEGFNVPSLDSVGVFSFLTCLLKPKSIGSVHLSSLDPHARASIDLNSLGNSDDLIPLRKVIRFALHLAKIVRKEGYLLKDLRVPASDGDKDVDEFIRSYIQSSYHYSSTCRMAPEHDPQPGVVDDELRVHGIDGLRVCDTSIFPEIVSVHTMAPAVVVAEKGADLLLSEIKCASISLIVRDQTSLQ